VPSLLAAIGGVIEQHMIDIGFIPPPEGHGQPRAEKQVKVVGEPTANARFRSCPALGVKSIIVLFHLSDSTAATVILAVFRTGIRGDKGTLPDNLDCVF